MSYNDKIISLSDQLTILLEGLDEKDRQRYLSNRNPTDDEILAREALTRVILALEPYRPRGIQTITFIG